MTPTVSSGNTFQAGPQLRRSDDGIWLADVGLPQAVSFPRGGHRECADIEEDSFWFRHRNRCIVALVRHFAAPGFIVDVGGGTGYVSLALQSAGVSTVLVEPEIAGARIARQRGVDPVICSTLEGAGFAPATLAGIGMFDVIEHVVDDVTLLEKARALLRTDGRIYVTVPAYPWLWSRDDEIAGHHRRYTTASLGKLLRSTGFRVDFVSHMFWPLPPAILLGRRFALRGRRSNDPDKYRRQHRGTRMQALMMDRLLDVEFGLLVRRWPVPFGSSCIAVASPSEA